MTEGSTVRFWWPNQLYRGQYKVVKLFKHRAWIELAPGRILKGVAKNNLEVV